jgi:hypothetical protein
LEMIPKNQFSVLDSVISFHVSFLSFPVLNPKTRKGNSDMYYIPKRL